MSKISRRKFVKYTGAVTSLAATSSINAYPQQPKHYDVVIVGAGLSGLSAANELTKLGITSLKILEAKHRIGGRTYNQQFNTGQVVDAGAQWIGPSQTEMQALIEQCSLTTFTTFNTSNPGSGVIYDGNQWTQLPIPTQLSTLFENKRVRLAIDNILASVGPQPLWRNSNPEIALYDTITVDQWLNQHPWMFTQTEKNSFANSILFYLGGTIQEISMYYLLFYIHSANTLGQRQDIDPETGLPKTGLDRLELFTGYGQDSTVVEGVGSIAKKLSQLPTIKNTIELNTALEEIAWQETDTLIRLRTRFTETGQSNTITARKVIFAISPMLLQNSTPHSHVIKFSPALPKGKQQLIQQWKASYAVKAHILYNTPFWRTSSPNGAGGLGHNGMALLSTSPATPTFLPLVESTFDSTRPGNQQGVLLAFLNDQMANAMTPQQRRNTVIKDLTKAFGPEAKNAIDYVDCHWAQVPYQNGCVSPLGTNTLSLYGNDLYTPIASLHWAGSETADVWNGYMEGAVRAGKRAATEVANSLAMISN